MFAFAERRRQQLLTSCRRRTARNQTRKVVHDSPAVMSKGAGRGAQSYYSQMQSSHQSSKDPKENMTMKMKYN